MIGGTAVIGTVAYQAYKKVVTRIFPCRTNAAMESQPASQQATMLKTNQDLLVQAMIFVAKADGHIDEQEKATTCTMDAG